VWQHNSGESVDFSNIFRSTNTTVTRLLKSVHDCRSYYANKSCTVFTDHSVQVNACCRAAKSIGVPTPGCSEPPNFLYNITRWLGMHANIGDIRRHYFVGTTGRSWSTSSDRRRSSTSRPDEMTSKTRCHRPATNVHPAPSGRLVMYCCLSGPLIWKCRNIGCLDKSCGPAVQHADILQSATLGLRRVAHRATTYFPSRCEGRRLSWAEHTVD